MYEGVTSCNCDKEHKKLVKVYWGIFQESFFRYCDDCIKEDTENGFKVEIVKTRKP